MKVTCICVVGLPGDPETVASVDGDTLIVDGVAYDLGGIPPGGQGTPMGDEHPFVGDLSRAGDGEISLSMRWSYSTATAAAVQPETPPVLTVTAGAVPDPILRKGA